MVEEIKSEREKTARAQLNTLKLQLDPHFMFNSLGTLSGIIVENPQKALDFTSRLSRIYKYIVAHLDQDSITLREGMRFIQDYCKHIEMRYKNHFVFDIASNICHDDEELILPLSLQLLVENAVKHNQHSEEHPLHIRIYRDDDFVCVSNELAPYTKIGYSKEEGTASASRISSTDTSCSPTRFLSYCNPILLTRYRYLSSRRQKNLNNCNIHNNMHKIKLYNTKGAQM